MLPTELIIPTAAAAVDWLRISVGMAQKVGRKAELTHAMVKNKSESGMERACATRPILRLDGQTDAEGRLTPIAVDQVRTFYAGTLRSRAVGATQQ
jgi:hypothetical protein